MTELKTGTLTIAQDGSFSFSFKQHVTFRPNQRFEVALRELPDLAALRKVRLHHWREVCRCSKALASGRGSPQGRALWERLHGEHMRAVQALNDLFPIDDTAERDASMLRGNL